jgi:tRNA(fMet)-specific endonuclease VapC
MASSLRLVALDTSIVIAALRGDSILRQRLTTVQGVITATVVGELFVGAYLAAQSGQQLQDVLQLLATSTVLPCDQDTGNYYAQGTVALRRQGMPIPDNDVWIAAVALQYALPLVTRDAHFERVPGLDVERW